MGSETAESLWGVLEPYLAAEGIELDDVEVAGRSGASLLRITLDAPEPVDVDRIARLSRGMSRLLDQLDASGNELIPGPYTLEVSSPGLERKLRRPRHFEKVVGREVRVKTTAPIDGERHLRGVVRDVGPEGFTLETETGETSLRFEDVATARTVFAWDNEMKPGNRR